MKLLSISLLYLPKCTYKSMKELFTPTDVSFNQANVTYVKIVHSFTFFLTYSVTFVDTLLSNISS